MSLREATVKWSPAPFAITAGEFKTPFTREYLIPVPALELADLATVVDSLAPKYDVGRHGRRSPSAPSPRCRLGVFNGEGANATANRDSIVMFVGRVTARPLPQLALGASATHDGADSLRWGVDASAQQFGRRGARRVRHPPPARPRARARTTSAGTCSSRFASSPRVQLVARQEDFQRPARGAREPAAGLGLRREHRDRARTRCGCCSSSRAASAARGRRAAIRSSAQVQAQL